jgi:glutathione peroxidase-family protein
MGKNQTRRLTPSILAEDLEIFAALKTLQNYRPANQAFTVEAISAIETSRMAAHDKEMQTAADYEAVRDDHVALQWDFHNGMLGAKDQVVAQFGPDSNEAQAMKLKKKSEYKNPTRKQGGSTPPATPM